jgi:hypothetical protein
MVVEPSSLCPPLNGRGSAGGRDDDDTDPLATQVANLFKAVYQTTLQALTRYSVHTRRPTAGLRGWPRRATDELGGQCIESEL